MWRVGIKPTLYNGERKIMSTYMKIKDMPNPSPGLINFFKKHKYGKIFAMDSSHTVKGFVSLKKLKSLPLREVGLRVGSPTAFGFSPKYNKSGATKSRAFSGTELKQKMFYGRSQGSVCLVGIGHKSTGTWMLDVTDRVIEELNEVGACAISKAHCKFEQVSPRIRKCKYCGDRLKRKVEIEKRTTWIREETI